MGFSGKTGTSAKALGSLRQYGLIEGIGDKTRVSDLALAILEPESEFERSDALRRSARSPDVFDAVLSRFSERVPQADEPIRAFLIRELGFQPGSADECIRALRQSLAFADEQSVGTDTFPEIEDKETAKAVGGTEREIQIAETAISPTQSANIPLTRECHAELRIYGPLSERAVGNLIRHIQLLADVWADEE
jgi:hypothetical protein